ncbi:MAG: L-histidine N(alpha)-methyltransferase [Acidobacteriota bacterium]|nr:L-histidine N(alpha)-methyltransferase [Acidobacteriota bacterium]
MPASLLYDELGSLLFEAITLLPEYGLTRADNALLRLYSRDIVEEAGRPSLILELGSGSGTKTRHILNAAAAQRKVRYLPIDISSAALDACRTTLDTIAGVQIEAIEARYLEGIARAMARRARGESLLILFLGSTIGNFDPAGAETFLRDIHRQMKKGDALLLGADLVKPRPKLLKAYDDSLGVTAAFNLNLLARINRELDADFDIAKFAHVARYAARPARIEMHLRSRVAQRVRIGALDLSIPFARGETVWTESSHKFHPAEIGALGERAGWALKHQWVDNSWGFAETLFECR